MKTESNRPQKSLAFPADWKLSPLKYATEQNRKVLLETTRPDYAFRYVDIGAVDAILGIQEYKDMTFDVAPSRARRVVSEGDTIISTVRTYLRAIAYVEDADNVVVSTGFSVQTPKSEIWPKYLYYYCISDAFIDFVNKYSTGVTYPAIGDGPLGRIMIAYPSIEEQKLIASYLDKECMKIDSIVEDLNQQILLLEKYRQTLITEVVLHGFTTNTTKDSGIEWLGFIPEHWEISKLKYCCSVKTGPFGTQLSADEYTDEGIPIINVKNIGYGAIIENDLDRIPDTVKKRLAQHILKEGDIVFGRKGAVDKHAIIDKRYAGWVQGSDCMRVRIVDKVLPRYLNYYFGSRGYSEFVISNSVGSTMASVNSQILSSSMLAIPPLEEQEIIIKYLDAKCRVVDGVLASKRAQLEAMKQQRESTIYEYVTGKKRVKGAATYGN